MGVSPRSVRSGVWLVPVVLAVFLASLHPNPVFAQTLPALPRVFLDTTYTPPSGNTITVNAGENLQAALNRAQLGDTIVLRAGATFTGGFILPKKTSGSGWIYIQSSNYSLLPTPGTRVTPTDAANMAKIVPPDPTTYPIRSLAGAHHFRFVGIEVTPQPGMYLGAMVNLGVGNETLVSQLPHDIVIDRCYIHGDPTVGTNKGVAMNGNAIAVIDSYISDFKDTGSGDTNALWAYNSAGPLKIVNNYLEAAGENVLLGGATPSVANLLVSDIEIRHNYFFKPVQWNPAHPSYAGTHYGVKNSLELKHGLRVLIEGNRFENSWADYQSGYLIVMTPKNESGGSPWVQVSDITFQYNHLLNSGAAFAISAGVGPGGSGSGDGPTLQSQRILIANNLLENMGWAYANVNGSDAGRNFNLAGYYGFQDLTLDHNTSITGGHSAVLLGIDHPPTPLNANLVVRNNILLAGAYGVFALGTSGGSGSAALQNNSSSYTYAKNALIGPWPTSGGVNTTDFTGADFWSLGFPANVAAVQFNNLAIDYSLAAGSPYKNAGTDGKDIGADIDAVNRATAGAIQGRSGRGTIPSPRPSLKVR